jgi:hypothetical protein
MIDVAARSTNGVKIPGRKATRADIMRTFKNHLTRLRNTLNVSNALPLTRCIVFNVFHTTRVPPLVAMSTPPVMHGRLETLMAFLLSPDIGSRRRYPCSGRLKVHS